MKIYKMKTLKKKKNKEKVKSPSFRLNPKENNPEIVPITHTVYYEKNGDSLIPLTSSRQLIEHDDVYEADSDLFNLIDEIQDEFEVMKLDLQSIIQNQDDEVDSVYSFTDYKDMSSSSNNHSSNNHNSNHTNMEEDEATIALANELRESCFAGFHSFVIRCPVLEQPHLSQIVHSSLAYMRFDPNYSYGDEDNDDNHNDNASHDNHSGSHDDEVLDDDFLDDDFSDQDSSDFSDDNSWKVRRSAIRAIAVVIKASKHDLSKLWVDEFEWRHKKKSVTVAQALVWRFKEREENCCVDVIDCFRKLLAVTVLAANNKQINLASININSMDTTTDAATSQTFNIDIQNNYTSSVVHICEKQLSVKKGGERTKSSALLLLTTLCSVPGRVGNAKQIKSVFLVIANILKGSTNPNTSTNVNASHVISKSLKLDGLSLVNKILSSDQHQPKAIHHALLTIIEPRLSAHDLDQEIKECALKAAVSLLNSMHPHVSDHQKNTILSHSQMILNSFLLKKITIDVDMIIDTIDDIKGPKVMTLKVGLKDMNVSLGMFLAIDEDALGDCELGSLLHIKNFLPCLLSSLHCFEIPVQSLQKIFQVLPMTKHDLWDGISSEVKEVILQLC